jgi:hypothetical protein
MSDLISAFQEEMPGYADIDEITARNCNSDDYSGIEYTFYGRVVPIRPVLDVVEETDNCGIENMTHIDEGDVCIKIFVAHLPDNDLLCV